MGRGYLPPGHIHVVNAGGKGEQGPPGEQGVPGPAGPSPWRTPVPWAPDATYSSTPPSHLVIYDGETYLCVDTHTSGNDFDPTRFVKIAARGANGGGSTASPIFIRANGTVVDSNPGVDDTVPNLFSFTDVPNALLSTVYVSNAITVSGLNAASPISVTGGQYSKNGAPFTTLNDTVVQGDIVQLRVTSSPDTSTASDVTLTIGGVSDTWSVVTTSVAQDTTPNPFAFTDVANASLNQQYTSDPITVLGINATTPISITGGQYSKNGGAFTSTAGTVVSGDQVTLRVTSSQTNNASVSATLTIGGVSDTWTVTTVAVQTDTTPNPFTFTDQAGVTTATVVFSNTITVSGINAPSPISISGNGAYSINGATFRTTSATVNNGDTVQLRLTSSASAGTGINTILTIGGVSDTWSVTTAAAGTDTTPNPFVFTDISTALENTTYLSNIVTITGINAPAQLFLTSETPGASYSKNGGAFTNQPTTVVNGDTIQLRLTTEPGPGGNVITLEVGGVSDTWNVVVPVPSSGSVTVNMPTFENGPWKWTAPYNSSKVLSKAGDAVEYWPNGSPDLKTIDDAYLDRQTDGSIIFYSPTDGARTSGSSYVRSELREILADGSNEFDWPLSSGGRLEATCRVQQLPVLTKGSTLRCIIGQIHGPNDEPCRLYYYSDGTLRFRDDKAIPTSGSTPTEREFVLTTTGAPTGTPTNIALNSFFTYVIEMDMTGVRVTVTHNGTKYWATSPKSSFWTSSTMMYFKAGIYNSVGYPGQGQTNEGTGGSKAHFARIINPTHSHTITSTSGNATG